MDKLVSMTDFVLELDKEKSIYTLERPYYEPDSYCSIITNYANFLKRNLELWMFVPCDEKGNVLMKPIIPFDSGNHYGSATNNLQNGWVDYNQAKKRMLFEGFEYQIDCEDHYYLVFDLFGDDHQLALSKWDDCFRIFGDNWSSNDIFDDIEDLIDLHLPLTETAKKLII